MSTQTSAEIVPLQPDQSGTLRNLLQLYQYDFSEIEDTQIGPDGRFHQLDAVEYQHAYLITANGKLAGFALVSRQQSSVGPESAWWSMREFFIMRAHRRTGIGRTAARLVIDRHPGAWEVTETPNNLSATEFWRTVLRAYGCQETTVDDPKWGLRPVQRFRSGESDRP
jgi:predicted acetyltransferase